MASKSQILYDIKYIYMCGYSGKIHFDVSGFWAWALYNVVEFQLLRLHIKSKKVKI